MGYSLENHLVGHPMPMPVVSFLEGYDLSGKTIINFSSHGSGRFGESISDLSKQVQSSYVGFGFEFEYSGGRGMEDEISQWLTLNGIRER